MKLFPRKGKFGILQKISQFLKRPQFVDSLIRAQNSRYDSDNHVEIAVKYRIPPQVQRQVWLTAQQQKHRAVHNIRVQRLDW